MSNTRMRSQGLREHYYSSEIDVFSEDLSSQEQLIKDLLDQGIDFQRLVRQIEGRRSRGELIDFTFDEYQEYLKYPKSDRSKIYDLALIAVYRCWRRCNETSEWPESTANLFLALLDLQEFFSRVKVDGSYRFGRSDYESLGLPSLDKETRESRLSELISECGLGDSIKRKVSSRNELVSCLEELSPWKRTYAFELVSDLFWDFESGGNLSILGVRRAIQQKKEYVLFKISEAEEVLSKSYFFKGNKRDNISNFRTVLKYFEELETLFESMFYPEREKSLSRDHKVFKHLVEEQKWGGKIEAILRVIEILDYAERKVSYETVILLEERKRAKDQAFLDGFMRKARREMRKVLS